MKRRFVVAITGASGTPYGRRLIEVLCAAGCDVHLTLSAASPAVLKQELALSVDLDDFSPSMLMLDIGPSLKDEKLRLVRNLAGISSEESHVLSVGSGEIGRVQYHHYRELVAPVASGSFLTHGMVICPCSGGTLSAVAHGTSSNLIQRAAEVHLKERRKLILVPRETPLSLAHLENMTRAAKLGAVILPAMPAFYHGATSILELVDFVVSRICDQLGVENSLIRRWGS
jgi:4-hydroxy-3-polyprenylbenzoate decarboxylase